MSSSVIDLRSGGATRHAGIVEGRTSLLVYLHAALWFMRRKPVGGLGGLLVLGMVGLAIAGPWVAPYDPNQSVAVPLSGMSVTHPFGVDHLGRDVFSRVVLGARTSLQVGVIAVTIGVFGGALLGILSGY